MPVTLNGPAIGQPGAVSGAWNQAPYPAAMAWSGWRPNIYIDAGTYKADQFNPRDRVDSRIWTGTAYHVDVVNGSTGNSGLGSFDGDFTNAKQQISAAITAGNATGAPYRIYVRAGYYAGSRCINGSTAIEPTQPCAIIAVGGAVYNVAGDAIIAWTQDGTYTNCYKYTVANSARVFDLAATDSDGAPLEMTVAADLATCNSTDNTYILTGGVLYVNRTDGAAATTANTLVTRALTSGSFVACTSDLYFEGIYFCGGITGGLHIEAPASRNIVTVGCRYIGVGSSAYLFDGMRIRANNGLVLSVGDRCYANPKDGFNFHYDNGPTGGKMEVVLIDPISNGNGRYSSTGNNGVTSHDDVRMICVNPSVSANRTGADFHCIEDTQTAIFGGTVAATSAAGAGNAAIKASNNCLMWLDGTNASATSGIYALHAQGAAGVIRAKRAGNISGTLLQDSGALLSSWTT